MCARKTSAPVAPKRRMNVPSASSCEIQYEPSLLWCATRSVPGFHAGSPLGSVLGRPGSDPALLSLVRRRLDAGSVVPSVATPAEAFRRTHLDRNERLREVGVTDLELARLRSPIGLDLGARTPEETALSIASEIIANRRGGSGISLTGAHTPIHRDATSAPARRIGSSA